MSESSTVCNGHKENNVVVEKYAIGAVVNELYPSEKLGGESGSVVANCAGDSMTIGDLQLPAFDHLYASSVDEIDERRPPPNMNVARSNLNSYHLNIIEEQAKIINAQSREICELKKQNDSLMARIDRINRRFCLNQLYNRNTNAYRNRQSFFNDQEYRMNEETFGETSNSDYPRGTQEGYLVPDDVPLNTLVTRNDPTEIANSNSTCGDSDPENRNTLAVDNTQSTASESDPQLFNNQKNGKFNFWIKLRRNKATFTNQLRRKRNKMVRFVEEKPDNSSQNLTQPKLNSAKMIEEKLKKDDAVFFFKALPDNLVKEKALLEPNKTEETDTDDGQGVKKKRTLKIPILTISETYFTSVKEDTSHLYDPITYTPTALEIFIITDGNGIISEGNWLIHPSSNKMTREVTEFILTEKKMVPSFRIIENDTINSSDIPKDYFEDVTVEAAKERHLRFEVDEKKRKKWDVQRIHELRRNERLKEKLRRRKSRWNKLLESPQQQKTEISNVITSLFPNIRTMEKVMITDAVPVTALGTSIPKIPSWGSCFKTDWKNDGDANLKVFEDNQHTHCHHRHNEHKDSRSKPA